ncbi:bifunctional [glutamine synthetase] adenylyltransferase/[glutamine synthetase]-adenylyl-L-tyrosine phosphorylase [Lacibacterium aquatile]|uniref:Bifunctional glutamine synthetase adenylyltransferase/adenylyl-removing enzyme n=1 Tax=Lacibacterium aquatile TaxID=1168082 RepID=A0ABW5DND9_9PROT
MSFLASLSSLPPAGRPDRVAVAIERWQDRIADTPWAERAASLIADPTGYALITAIFGNSPYLTESWLAESETIFRLIDTGPDRTMAEILGAINDGLAAQDTMIVARELRRAKRQAALVTAIADIGGVWSLEQVTEILSDLASRALDCAAGHALALLRVRKGEEMSPELIETSRRGLVILGMGKLGARELNYSSDIDIIVLYDADRVVPQIMALMEYSLTEVYVKATRTLVKLLHERDADGYVFRTDLRLRPDPASTPLAMSVLSAETYYETVGQNWERAAMIKARPVAGDIDAGLLFLKNLRPYIWRKHLDFAAIQDIHSIKRQIHAHKGGGDIAVYGHNVKVGRGGIREIEFFAQTQQLIWGGRDPAVRVSGTIPALYALVNAGRVQKATADELAAIYRYLRKVEHRLQMVEDQQTHSLPNDRDGLERIAAFLDEGSAEAFEAHLMKTFGRVQDIYADLFEEAPTLSASGSLVFTGIENDPDTIATLSGMGYRDGPRVSETVRGWHHGRIRATRSTRARELLTELMPALLAAFGKTPDPDGAFGRFDTFLSNLPAGVQLFSLLYSNPQLLDTLAEVMGAAPALADYLGRHPRLLDGLLADTTAVGRDGLANDLTRQLDEANSYEEALDLVRRWTGDRRFQAGLALLRGTMTPEAGGIHLSNVAEVVIAALLAPVEAAFQQVHGEVPGGRFAVIAYGKLGARELSPTSDLDLVFLYDFAEGAEQSNGTKPLPPSLYFQRLGQRLISALTALTAEGELYQVDMRLRPSGNKGPVASEFAGFIRYQREEAWTWEHMALTRARPVAGDADLQSEIETVRQSLLTAPRDTSKLLLDIADMRRRVARERPGNDPFDIKDRPGGLVDVEFIAQFLMLSHARKHPGLLSGHTSEAFEKLGAAGILPLDKAERLARGSRLWQAVQSMLRLMSLPGRFDPDTAPADLKRALARGAQHSDFAALQKDMADTAATVRAIWDHLIEQPAAFLAAEAKED